MAEKLNRRGFLRVAGIVGAAGAINAVKLDQSRVDVQAKMQATNESHGLERWLLETGKAVIAPEAYVSTKKLLFIGS